MKILPYAKALIALALLQCENCHAQVLEDDRDLFFIVTVDKKSGMIDMHGDIVIPIEYSAIKPIDAVDSVFIVKKALESSQKHKWGVIDINDDIIIPFEHDRISFRKNGLKLIGLINKTDGKQKQTTFDIRGNEVFPTEFDDSWYLNDTIAKIKSGNQEYLIDKNGRQITRKYDQIYELVNGMIKIKEQDLSGFLDSNYHEEIEPKYDWFATGYFKDNGLANVRHQDTWTEAEITKNGEEVFNIGINYRYHDNYRKGDYLLAYEVDPNGDNPTYDHCVFNFNTEKMIYNFGPSMAGAGYELRDDRISFWGRPMQEDFFKLTQIDTTGILIHETQIPLVHTVTNDALVVYRTINNKKQYGIVSKDGNVKTELIYDDIDPSRNKESSTFSIVARKDDKYGVIDEEGSVVIDFIYDYISKLKSANFVAKRDLDYYLISNNGEILKNCNKIRITEEISHTKNWCIAEFNNKFGVFDFNNKMWIIQAKYSKIETIFIDQ